MSWTWKGAMANKVQTDTKCDRFDASYEPELVESFPGTIISYLSIKM